MAHMSAIPGRKEPFATLNLQTIIDPHKAFFGQRQSALGQPAMGKGPCCADSEPARNLGSVFQGDSLRVNLCHPCPKVQRNTCLLGRANQSRGCGAITAQNFGTGLDDTHPSGTCVAFQRM